MFDISASIVLFKNDKDILRQTVHCFLKTNFNIKLYLVDNSPSSELSDLVIDPRIEYIFTGVNLGFGRAHNLALAKALLNSKYHLILNPDVTFPENTLEKLFNFMEGDKSVGLVSPKILSFDGQIQYLCKRLPTPMVFFYRRFSSIFSEEFIKELDFDYEMRNRDYEKPFEAPSLSGCFMFFRCESLKVVGLFDKRFFMYVEDIDISRRMAKQFRNVYFPEAHIFHKHERASYRLNRLLVIHFHSVIKYFNKWGWFFDKDREVSLYE